MRQKIFLITDCRLALLPQNLIRNTNFNNMENDNLKKESNNANVLLVADKINWEDLKEGDIVEYEQCGNYWVKAKVFYHWRGNKMIEIIEGWAKGTTWYLLGELKRIRCVVA